ncbi:Peptidase M48, Ste24p, partial [Candidatus Magnetomorum sp. HK-1]
VIVYLMYPSFIIRRNNLRILDKKSYTELYKFIEELKQGFKTIKNSEITLYANIVPYDVNGFVFGTKKKIYISMTLGLLKLYKSNNDFFKIIIKHELSHAENNDIYKTYLIETLWKILLFICSIIFFIMLFQNIDYKTTVTISVISILIVFILFFLKNSFLKQRELFADARTINYIEEMDIFLTIINRYDKKLFHNNPKGGFTGSWYHPKKEKRVEVVRNPNILFDLNRLSGFCIGFFIGHSFFTMQIIGSYTFGLIFFITILFIGYLISLKMIQNKLLSKIGNAKKFKLVKCFLDFFFFTFRCFNNHRNFQVFLFYCNANLGIRIFINQY